MIGILWSNLKLSPPDFWSLTGKSVVAENCTVGYYIFEKNLSAFLLYLYCIFLIFCIINTLQKIFFNCIKYHAYVNLLEVSLLGCHRKSFSYVNKCAVSPLVLKGGFRVLERCAVPLGQ